MAAPYIMPDGPGGRPYRLTEHARGGKSSKGKSSGARGKEEAWSALQAKMGSSSLEDIAELKAIERAGWRRRNRWFNDKVLRDGYSARFGKMTLEDMQNQFNPPPFGIPPKPSIFSEVTGPEHAALWEHFRSINMDREQKVLDRWEQHDRHQRRDGAVSSSGSGAAPEHGPVSCPAAAMRAWSRVSRAARTALKKANPHAVMDLEHQVLDLIEGGDTTAELLMDVPDGFGRLLVHGLCEFHGLLSATRNAGGRPLVAVYFRRPSQTTEAEQQQQRQGDQDGPEPVTPPRAAGQAPSSSSAAAGAAVASEAPSTEAPGAAAARTPGSSSTPAAASSAAAAAAAVASSSQHPEHEITCTDVLLAIHESGAEGGFDAAALGRFVRHMHVGSDAMSDDFVLVH